MCVAMMSIEHLTTIHAQSGYLGIKYTLYFTQQTHLAVIKVEVEGVVKECKVYQFIDLLQVHWAKKHLNVNIRKEWEWISCIIIVFIS